jgi:hypothetical protein
MKFLIKWIAFIIVVAYATTYIVAHMAAHAAQVAQL